MIAGEKINGARIGVDKARVEISMHLELPNSYLKTRLKFNFYELYLVFIYVS